MAGNRQQFTLQFNADTSQAKKSIQELNNALQNLQKAQSNSGFADLGINKAVESAEELTQHLNKALNINTGKLNLSAFQNSLQASNTSLKSLTNDLLKAGTVGQQAFLAMAGAIAQAEVPLRQTNKTIKDLAQSLKNTIKWEISSTTVHSLESALSGAVSYVKDLNSSLNNIRIVTGQSAEDMVKFAQQANRAARELSTTTKAYSDASLIYYQQGDSAEQAAKKAAITIKAANSSFNTSAAEMSEYLTAVWNSYQVGADELERYVDIMAALGAKTATSLEEIATSMQKVAATANTVGVSMEQVSSIISTVSSVTRESAESIGTSYKTIFARIGDLKLGKALDDGVTLGQVSSQLDKIGVKILDTNGEMRDMGTIIEDLGSKWQTMSRAEQTAIAQVVAGKRQYTQLMALFENWDMYQNNMNIAQNAEGSLENMYKTQAESVEASSARMRAALENLYSKFINDTSIIKFTESITKVVDAISSVIDAFGGLPGILGNVGAIAIKVFSKDIAGGIDKTLAKLTTFTSQFTGKNIFKEIAKNGVQSTQQIEQQKAMTQARVAIEEQKKGVFNESGRFAVNEAAELLSYKEQLLSIQHQLTDAQKEEAQAALNNLSQQQAEIIKLKADKEQMQKDEVNALRKDKQAILREHSGTDALGVEHALKSSENKQKHIQEQIITSYMEGHNFDELYGNLTREDVNSIDAMLQKSKELGTQLEKTDQALEMIRSQLRSGDIQQTGVEFDILKEKIEQLLGQKLEANTLDDLREELQEIGDEALLTQEQLNDLVINTTDSIDEVGVGKKLSQALQNSFERGQESASLDFELNIKTSSLEKAKQKIKDALNPKSATYSKIAEGMTKAASATGSLIAGLSTGGNLLRTMTNEASSLADKLGSVAGGISTLISGFSSGGWLGLAASAIGMIISGISTAIQKAEEERKKLVEENKAKAQEINNANSAELSSTKNLLNTYNELYARYQAGENVQNELKSSALALADAYGLTSASVAAMTGNFELFNQEVAKTLNFADQMSDAKIALGNAGQAVTDSKNIGSISVNMADYLGVYTDMDNANANVAAMIQEDALLSQATALKTTDDVTWKFLDEIYRQQGLNDNWSLESEHMLDAFIEFASQKASNYQEAFSAALEKYGLEDTGITATTARDKILDTLKDKVDIGKFLQAFYSNALLKGSEELNLADMGYSLAEIKSENWADFWAYGANSAAYQISSMENLDMEGFKNIAFSESGLKSLREANSSNNFSLEKIWNNFTDLYDSETGKFRWDDNLNAEDTVALYDRYVAWKDYLQKMLDNIVDTNSTEYQIISQFLTGVEKITDNEELSGAVSTYKEAQKNLVQWQLIQNSIKNSVGKSEQDTSFTDYIKFQKDLAKSVDDQYTTFDSLKEFSEDDVTNLTDEYVAAREKVVSQLISEFTAFDDYATMYSALSMSFNDDQMSVISQLIDAQNLAASDITYNFIEALKTYFASVGKGATLQGLSDNTLIQNAIAMSQAATAYDANRAGRDQAIASESSFKKNMTQAEAETFYSNYWGNEKIQELLGKRGKSLISLDEFIDLGDYDAQMAYLESISAELNNATQESAENIINSHDTYIQTLEGLFTQDEKQLYGNGDQVAQDNYNAWKAFESLYTETDDGKYIDTQGNIFDTREEAFADYIKLPGVQLSDEAKQLDLATWESFANIMSQINAENAEYASAQTTINAGGLVGKNIVDEFSNSITKLSTELSTLENEFNALNSIDISEVPKAGTQAYKALSTSLEKTGKTMSDYRRMSEKDRIKALSKAKQDSLEAQRNKQKDIENAYANKYGFNISTTQEDILATGDQTKIAAYNAWIASQQAQANLTDQIIQEDQNRANQLIQIGVANTEAAIARFEQEQAKLQDAAEKMMEVSNILSSHIDGSELTFAERAKLDPVVLAQWDALTSNTERANFAAQQTAEAYQKQMEYQQKINDGIAMAESRMKYMGKDSELLLSNTTNFKTSEAFANWMDITSLSDAAKSALKEADAIVRPTLGDSTTYSEWAEAMRDQLKLMGEEGSSALALLEAKGKDAMSNIFSEFSKQMQDQAQAAVDAWIKAFNDISKAKQKLLSGGNLIEDIAGDPAKLIEYARAANLSVAEASKAIIGNTLNANQFTTPTFDINQHKAAYGLDLTSYGGFNFGQRGLFYDQRAILKQSGLSLAEANEANLEEVNKTLTEKYTKILTDAKLKNEDGTTWSTDQINDTVAKILSGDVEAYQILTSASNDLTAAMQGSAAAMSAVAAKAEAESAVQAVKLKDQKATVNGKSATQSELTDLQGAIERAQEAKYANKGWDSLSSADQELLSSFDISFDNVDTAAESCANALLACAEAALTLAKQAANNQGYYKNAKGNYAQAMTEDEYIAEYGDTFNGGEEEARAYYQRLATSKDAEFTTNAKGEQLLFIGNESEAITSSIKDAEDAVNSFRTSAEQVPENTMQKMAESVDMTKNEFEQFTKAMIDTGEITATTTEGQYEQARSLARIKKGLKTTRDSMKKWQKSLKESKGDAIAHNKVLSEMRSSFEEILDMPVGALNDLSEEFMTSAKTAKLLKGAMEGDIDAYNKLQASVAEQILIGAGATVSLDVQNAINTIATEMDNLPVNEPIVFGELARVSPALYDALNTYISAVAQAGGDVQAAAAALGFDVQTVTHTFPYKVSGPQYSPGSTYTDPNTGQQYRSIHTSINEAEGTIDVTAIKVITNKGTRGGNIGGSRPKSSGGGGGSKPKKLDKKKPEDEKERYHYLDQQLKRLNESFTETDKLKDRTYGNKHLKNLEQEISLLKEQLDVQRDYIKAAKEYLAIDQQRVASLGATFDADGNITNYEEVMDSIIGKYNDFIDRYNSASASQQENMEEEKEEWDKWYEEKIEWISQYEETLATVNEKQNDLLETQNKISEAMLEKIQYKVEVKVDINKDEQDLLDYLSEKYDEVIEKQGVIMNNLIRESELAQDNIRALEQSRYELELAFNSGNINQADYVEGLRDINEQLLDNLKTINDVKKDIEELYSDTIEDASKVIDKQTQKINNASEAMKSYISILQLLGKGQNYEDLMYFYEKQYDYNKASLQTQMDLLEVLKQEEKYYLDRIDSASGLTETEREQYEALQETMQDVQKEILSSTESTLQSLQEKYNNTINSIMKNLEESIVGEGNSLNWLSEEYSYYLEEFNRYLSAQKQLYEINKLNRNIDKSIADTTETLYRKQLKQLQDEINAKAESNSLSEYELNIMNLKYELLLKQIALEEAQNAKSTVRLTRDSEGNMIYQYTADADEISKAQQEYEDVLQQMVDANYEQIHNVEQQTIETYQNMVDKIKEIASDETLTQEQKMERIIEIVSQTKDTLRYLLEQYNITSENLMYTNELVSERYNTALWEHSENAKNNMNTTIAEMIANTDKYVAEMQNACGNGGSIQSALEDYSTKVDEIAELTGTRYGDMIDAVQDYDRVTEDAEDETRKMANELRNNLLPQIHTTTNAWDTYYKTLRTSITQTEALISKNNALISSLAQITQAAQRAQSAIASVSSARVSTPYGSAGGSSGSGSGGNGSSGSGSKSTTTNTTTDGKYYLTVNGNKVGNGVYSASEAAKMAALQRKYGNYQSTDVVSWAQFATGGLADYTGPAWLDGTKNKPELILNPEDTQNMFRTIDAVRQLDKTTLNIMDDFINFATSSMMANMFNLHAGSTNGSSGELQQNVQITAEFPNVQDRNEIEAAFDNLINRASQFIGSKGRP